ncbi:non-ribosomal peptide synthetase [Streptomyces sp. JJ36]|uniref:non-ribosomal peptide synthetase n=1 Tax=Streptomyces sp. JJ36 TaxID=2736645 RepID=UPI001F2B87FD|nr:non-ribosomal peptide synthetase [Streptomyces sp. JJ36]MCF6522525.1 amino acid adenylation domain-containing protein [Streptomyces sp. JJ36]
MTVGLPNDTGLRSSSLLGILRERVEADPEAAAFRFTAFDERDGRELPPLDLSRGLLDTRARSMAATLQHHGAGGRRVLLLLPPGEDFVTGQFGCYYAGSCIVACAPPKGAPDGVQGERFVQVGLDADVAAVVCHGARVDELRAAWQAGGAPGVPWIAVDGRHADPDLWTPPAVRDDDLALMQYTSGSTGNPKGVMVSNANLLAQLRVFRDLAGLPDGAETVTWMPVYHALGIAGTVTMSQFIGGRCTLLAPEDFVAEPFRWLKAVSDATAPVFSCGPNFAYDRCVEHVSPEQRAELDLSRWHAAFNAAERVQRRTIDAFTETFAPHGFRPEAWFPGYGLTEVTLGICGRRGADPLTLTVDAAALEQGTAQPAGPGTSRTLDLVSCGPAHPGVRMLVVDPGTRTECAQGEVGEIWVGGDVVNQGYWRRPEQTEETFAGRLAGGAGPYLRTGDLAFRHGEDVVVCGRLKELVIIRGRNIHPQDVEAAARRAHPALTAAPGAAFSVDAEEGERLIVVQGVDPAHGDAPELAGLARLVRTRVAAEQEVEPDTVLLVHPDHIPTTGSGKIRRTTCRQSFLDGGIEALHSDTTRGRPGADEPGRGAAEARTGTPAAAPLRDMVLALAPELRAQVVTAEVRRRIGAALAVPPEEVPEDTPLIALGLESLRIVELRYALGRDFDLTLPMADFVRGSLADVAGRVLNSLRGDGTEGIAWPELVADPAHRHEPFPLTEIQHGYLVGRSSAYDLGGSSIHLYTEYDCPDLDVQRLRTALDALVDRQEMLRAVISADGHQRILPDVGEVPVTEYDLRGAGPAALDAHLERVRDELGHQVLPLDQWPMFDVRVTWTGGDGDRRARVHVSLDLLVADVASVRLFFLELGDLYAGGDAALPPLTVSFRDYVLAARGLRDTEAYTRSKAYWQERLPTLPPNPQLPVSRTGLPPGARPERRRRVSRLDAGRWARVKERASARGITPSAVQLAAYATVLGAWSRTSHFTIDVPLFNRHPLHPDIDLIIGDFTSVTLLEVDLRPGGGFLALADRIQHQLWRDLDHRFFSGVEVMREIARARGVSAGAYAGIVFASAREQGRDQDFSRGELGADWLGETVHAVSQTPQVLLDHQVYEDRGALTYKWDAVEALFPPGVMDDMFAAYDDLLHALADDEEAWNADTADVLPAAHREITDQANDTAGDLPDELLCTAVVAQAERHPDRTAVLAGGRTLTYGELYRHACRLGRRLREHGAAPGSPVAVALGKSVEQIVAVLAVHLSGAGYLPLDPDLPAGRRDKLLAHSGARLVLTPPGGSGRAPAAGTTAIPVDLDAPGDDTPLSPVQRPDDLAYVLYTSGSTGEPKGVALSHRAVLNTVADFTDRCALTPEDRALALSALSFDLSAGDLFAVLRSGGALVLPEPEAVKDPGRWIELMSAHGVTVWNSVPALMRMLLEHLGNPDGGGRPAHPGLAALRLVWFSGDWIPLDLPGRVRAAAPSARVVASGGPTETAIWCVAHDVTEDDRDVIPYGLPMRNHTIDILDDRMQPCPLWVAGEMYIGGSGLADGYWRDPERTAASFVVHPRTGRRLYRSGDLGRRLPNGEIEILGREDSQVKIRGHRIELGEIEAALLHHDDVRTAAVTPVGDGPEGLRLAAVVVPEGTGTAGDARAGAPEEAPGSDGDLHDEALGDVITDPLERLAFKARRPGLRTGLDGTAHPFPAPGRPHGDDAPPPRRSRRDYGAGPLPQAALGRLLEPLCAEHDDGGALPRHRYASAGALYPVQTYLHVAEGRVEGLPGGTYYHDPDGHRLVEIRPGAVLDAGVHAPENRPAHDNAAFTLFLVAHRDAVEPLYGKRARDFSLLEAGLMTQLLDGHATACGIGLCQVGFVRDTEELRDALALGESAEILHGMLGGVLTDEAAPAPDAPGGLSDMLARHLAATLPDHMVPATFVEVPALPLTARGKLDRAALRRLAEDAAGGAGDGPVDGGAENDTEAEILAVFRAALPDGTRLTVRDRFFDMGADSVVIVRIHRALKEALGRDFPLMTMFEHATIRTLAAHLTGTHTGRDVVDDALQRARARRRRPARRG